MKIKLNKIISLLLLIFILFLSGCGYGELRGEIVDKKYTPSRVVIQSVLVGKTLATIPVTHPESWSIKIQKQESGEIKNTWINVSEKHYENANIGDYYEGEVE